MNAVSEEHPVRWQPDRSVPAPPWPVPPLSVAMSRGFLGRCPACGQTKLFRGFLKVEPVCANCGAPLGAARADDAPPYFTIAIVAHVVIGLLVWVEVAYSPPLWVHAAIFLPLTLVMTFALMQPVKGATVGLMLHVGLMKPDNDD